jgi:nitrogen fixation NifU-like protein
MSDLRELYQEVILDHNRNPHNFRTIEEPSALAEGHNPNCGDHIRVFVEVDDGKIKDVSFQGSGCAISKASASLMTDSLKGKSLDEAEALYSEFHAMVTSPPDNVVTGDRLGKLTVFSGVCEFPARVKCASLAWHTVRAALHQEDKSVTTE